MSDLPTGWIETTLGEVVDYGKTEKVEPKNIPADAWLLELEDIEKDTSHLLQRLTFKQRGSKSTKNAFKKDDVLYGKLRPYLNKVIVADEDGFCTTEIIPIEPNFAINGRYLFYWLKTPKFLNYVNSVSYGLNMPRLGTKVGLAAPLILAPTPEQKRISDKLDTLMARVDSCQSHLERVPEILKRFRRSVLAEATTGRLTEEWREKNPGNTWETISLGDLCTNSFYGPRFGRNEYTDLEEGIPTVRTTDMTSNGRIEITKDTPRVLVPAEKVEHYRAKKGDLLITRSGSIGVIAVFEGNYLAIPGAYLIRFRFSKRVLSRYVFYCLMSPDGQEKLGLSATAITQPNVNAESIKKIMIQLPSIDEQQEVVRRVERLFAFAERLEVRWQAGQNLVEQLTPSLLAKAFRGELVGQDPEDESAAVVLERVRAARKDE